MATLLELLLLLVTFLLGVLCLIAPMTIARIIALWPKFVFGRLFPDLQVDPELEDAIQLIENAPENYRTQFKGQFAMIRVTGVVALLVALAGICLIQISFP